MPTNRTVTLPGIWAELADNLPISDDPTVGTTYRDSSLTQDDIKAGWPFATVNPSHKFNEVMRTLTSLMGQIEQWGVLPWYPGNYQQNAWVMGSNGVVYKAKRANSNKDPISNPLDWGTMFDGNPIGSITSWVPGYFANSANGGFVNVLGSANTIASANAYLNGSGWYVCDGSLLNNANSPIFNGSGRYLPNLTDNRFLMGSNSCGGVGGSNSSNHNHSVSIGDHVHATGNHAITVDEMPTHIHEMRVKNDFQGIAHDSNDNDDRTVYRQSNTSVDNVINYMQATGGGHTHNHGNTSTSTDTTNTSNSSATENRPQYLSCFYIMKVS